MGIKIMWAGLLLGLGLSSGASAMVELNCQPGEREKAESIDTVYVTEQQPDIKVESDFWTVHWQNIDDVLSLKSAHNKTVWKKSVYLDGSSDEMLMDVEKITFALIGPRGGFAPGKKYPCEVIAVYQPI